MMALSTGIHPTGLQGAACCCCEKGHALVHHQRFGGKGGVQRILDFRQWAN